MSSSNHRETIYTLGFPRSGNTWLCRLLGDALDCPIQSGLRFPSNADEGFDRPGPYIVRMRHYSQVRDDFPDGHRLIHIIRDPRDVLVSVREYWKTKGWSDALLRVQLWQEQVRRWIDHQPTVRFERMLADPELIFGTALKDIGLTSRTPLAETVQAQSWTNRLEIIHDGLPYGPEHQRLVLGHGRTGRWRESLTREVGRAVHHLFWPLMRELGYEDDPGWWEVLPSAY